MASKAIFSIKLDRIVPNPSMKAGVQQFIVANLKRAKTEFLHSKRLPAALLLLFRSN
jgi:hypothetical protein